MSEDSSKVGSHSDEKETDDRPQQCGHEWVLLATPGPNFGSLEAPGPALIRQYLRCLKCGMTRSHIVEG
jgi:hypothetical protein